MNRTTIAAALLLACLSAPAQAETIVQAARAIETELGGRVGVALRRQGDAQVTGHRPDERFPCPARSRRRFAGRS